MEVKDAKGAMDAVQDLIAAAKKIRDVNEAQKEYTRKLQAVAAMARRTGESLSCRMPPQAYDYGDAVCELLAALERYEKCARLA